MDYTFSTVRRRHHLTFITLNRPEVLNALHSPAHYELAKIFDEFETDPQQWVAIITGAGDRAFCAGNDLKYQAGGGEMQRPESGFAGITSRFSLDKPLIAAVNGVAMGGGFEVVLACDLVIASERAVFALPEPRVGTAALAGGVQRLARQIGLKQAMGMVLTGRRVSAHEGHSLGFVNEVTSDDGVLETAERWADSILECSPLAVRASKQAMMRGLDEPSLADAVSLQRNYPAARAMFESSDYMEGPKAFSEKRPPRWQGR